MAIPDNTQESMVTNRRTKDLASRDRQREEKVAIQGNVESKNTNTLLKKLLKTSKDAATRARKFVNDPETKRKSIKGASMLAEVFGAVTQGSKGTEGLQHDIRRMMMVKKAKSMGNDRLVARIQGGMTTNIGKSSADRNGYVKEEKEPSDQAQTKGKNLDMNTLTTMLNTELAKFRDEHIKGLAVVLENALTTDRKKDGIVETKKTKIRETKKATTQAKAQAKVTAEENKKAKALVKAEAKAKAEEIKKAKALVKAQAKVTAEENKKSKALVKAQAKAKTEENKKSKALVKAKTEENKKSKALVKVQAKANAAEQFKNEIKIDQKKVTREARIKAKDDLHNKIAEVRRKSAQDEKDRDALKAQTNSDGGSVTNQIINIGDSKTKGRTKQADTDTQKESGNSDLDLDKKSKQKSNQKSNQKPNQKPNQPTQSKPSSPKNAGNASKVRQIASKLGSKAGGLARLAARGALQMGGRLAALATGTAGAVVGSAVAGLAIGTAISESGLLQKIGFYDQTDANAYSVGDLVDKVFGDGTRNVRRVAEREAKNALKKADEDFRKMKGGVGPWLGMSDSQVKDFAKNRSTDFANYHRLYLEEMRLGAFDSYLQGAQDSDLISDTDKEQSHAKWKQAMDARIKFKKDVVLNGVKAVQKQAAQNTAQGQKNTQANTPTAQAGGQSSPTSSANGGQTSTGTKATQAGQTSTGTQATQGSQTSTGTQATQGSQTSTGTKATQGSQTSTGTKATQAGHAQSGGNTIGTPNGMVKVDIQQIQGLQSWMVQSFIPALAQAMGNHPGSNPQQPPKTPGRAVPSSPGVMR